MKVEKYSDNIGKTITISEAMVIIHSVGLSGEPLLRAMTVHYLRGKDTEIVVQTQVLAGEKREWDLAAVVNADFKSGKLDGLKKYAEEYVDAEHPVATFRQMLIHNAACIMPAHEKTEHPAKKAMVTHSRVRQD